MWAYYLFLGGEEAGSSSHMEHTFYIYLILYSSHINAAEHFTVSHVSFQGCYSRTLMLISVLNCSYLLYGKACEVHRFTLWVGYFLFHDKKAVGSLLVTFKLDRVHHPDVGADAAGLF